MSVEERVKFYQNWLETLDTKPVKSPKREEFLHLKGRIYESNRQKAQQEQHEKERSSASFRPKIHSKFSSPVKVETRLLRAGSVYKLKSEKKRKPVPEEAAAKTKSLSPSEAHALGERLHSIASFYREKREKSLRIQEELESKTLSSPRICPQSTKMQEHKRNGKVEDRLIQSFFQKQDKQETNMLLSDLAVKMASSPNISKFAQHMKRKPENIEDRLTRYQHLYKKNLQSLRQMYEPTVEESDRRMKFTSPRLCTPKSTKENAAEFSFQPQISPQSKKIASKMGKSQDRITKHNKPVLAEKQEFTFKPAVNSASSFLDNRKKMNKERWQILYEDQICMQQKKQELRNKYTLEEDRSAKKCFTHFNVQKVVDRLHRKDENTRVQEDPTHPEYSFKPTINRNYTEKHSVQLNEINGVSRFFQRHRKSIQDPQPSSTKSAREIKEISASEFLKAVEGLHRSIHNL